MGKHHTYRKRGTSTLSPTTLLHQPPPSLSIQAGQLLQSANITDNYGGQVRLYYSPIGSPYSWAGILQDAWTQIYRWGAVGDLAEGWYYGSTYGNGTKYVIEWVNSNIIHLVH